MTSSNTILKGKIPPMKSLKLVLMLALVASLAIGCSQNKANEPAATNTSDAQNKGAVVQEPAGAVDKMKNEPDVDDLELGKSVDANKKVTDGTDDFSPKDTIYLSVKTDGAAANSQLKVRWTYGADNKLVKEDTRTIPAGGAAYTEFHISKPGGFPTGDYKVQVWLNGDDKGSKTFEVKSGEPAGNR